MHNPVTFKGWAFERAVCETQEHAGSSLPLPRLLPFFLFFSFYVPSPSSPFFFPLARSLDLDTFTRGGDGSARLVNRSIESSSSPGFSKVRDDAVAQRTYFDDVYTCVCGDNDYEPRAFDRLKGSNEKERKDPPVDRPSSRYLGNSPIVIHPASMTGPSRVEGVTRWDRNASHLDSIVARPRWKMP